MQRWLVAGLTLLASGFAHAQASAPSLVPLPASIKPETGTFVLSPSTRLCAEGRDSQANADLLNAWLRERQGWALRDCGKASAETADVIRLESAGKDIAAEAYQLHVQPRGVNLRGDAAGQFYGVQTLMQLLPIDRAQRLEVPAQRIEDAPRFAYRGMHLDVARHRFPVALIKQMLDRMAHYKLNRFHWHLTDDQGWRIEIKRYPRLTEVGAQRKETDGDGTPYGGFYTQDEVRDVVAYAARLHITVIPEIEMPGHALAALAAYPELGCTPGPFETGTTWGVFDDIFCPTEPTFKFLENVLDEVIPLFPAPYVHIGGDEAPKTRWQQSAAAQEVIRREGLKDEHELQSWFIRRIERFLHSRGKRLIGWDEILEGGLAPDATVMSWRGEAGGIAAARHGNDVIMTPTRCCYFDYGQGPKDSELWQKGGELPIETVYAYDPVPVELEADKRHHILGVQANVWTERIPREEVLEYMVFPRLLALAEIAWTPQAKRDFDAFDRRLSGQYPRLAQAGVGFRIPAPWGLRDGLAVEQDQYTLDLRPRVPGSRIHYTLDGSVPTTASPQATGPVSVTVPADGMVTVRTLTITADGRESAIHRATLRNRRYKPAQAEPTDAREAGVSYRYYEGTFDRFAEMEAAKPVRSGSAQAFDWRGYGRHEHFGLVFEGWLHVPEDGLYRFRAQADDASALYIDGEAVVRNETYDQPVEGSVPLRRGWHRLRLDFYQRSGDIGLGLSWAKDDASLKPLDATQLRH
jgi:hexosaminidase